jgi:hypothetical protein
MKGHTEKSEGHTKSAVANNFSAQQKATGAPVAQLHRPDIIQRYSIVQPDNLKAQKHATVETQDLQQTPYGSTYVTKSQQVSETGFNPATQETTRERVSGNQQQQVSGLPAFKVSQNGQMALPEEGQAKNFYSTSNRVNSANKIFEESGASIRLKTEGHGIAVPKNPVRPDNKKTNALKKVHAATEVPNNITQQLETQIQTILPAVQCNDFVRQIMGASAVGSRVAVLKNKTDKKEVVSTEGREPVNDISTHLSNGITKPADVETRMRTKPLNDKQKETGIKNYENLSVKTRSKHSKELGINEHAMPKVGEGYVIRSQDTTEKSGAKKDGVHNIPNPRLVNTGTKSGPEQQEIRDGYLESLQALDDANAIVTKSRKDVPYRIQEMMKTWGQHYAGVVGVDGVDTVTLENYNRSTEVSWEHERIFNNLFRDFDVFRNLVSDRVSGLQKAPDDDLINQLVTLASQAPGLQLNYQQALQEALTSFQTGMQRTNDTHEGNFYFDMYGPGLQSFHERYKGLSSNPVTLHIKETTQPVVQQATDGILDLHNAIGRWEPSILAHPMTGTAQQRLLAIIQAARAAEQKSNLDLAAATTRKEYSDIYDYANNAWNTFVNAIRAEVLGSFQIITGNAPVPAINSLTDIPARCVAFRNTYKWYHPGGKAYPNSTQLEAMAQALTLAGL